MMKRDEQGYEALVELVARTGPGERLLPWLARRLRIAPTRRVTGRELLRLVLDGDPLSMQSRTHTRRRRCALALPRGRAVARAVALVAMRAPGPRGDAPAAASPDATDAEVWLDRCARDAVVQLAREQRDEERRGLPWTRSPDRGFYSLVARRLGLEADQGRVACVALNRLPLEVRRAFVSIELEGTTFRRFVAEGFGPPRRVRERMRAARRALFEALETDRARRARSARKR